MITQTSPSPDTSSLDSQFHMTHTFHLRLGTSELAASQLESTLKTSHARVNKWLILRRAGCYEHSITVDGIGVASARALRKALANLSKEIKVHVEHMLHFDRAPQA